MNKQVRLFVAVVLSLGFMRTASAEPDGNRCVICGEHTFGGQAVILEDHAYSVHEFSCKAIWFRARKAGMLDKIAHPIVPADPLFSRIPDAVNPPASPGADSGGLLWFWASFLGLACTVSGMLAAIFGKLTNRSVTSSFILGFCIPAVGMVLVPVLPENKKSA